MIRRQTTRQRSSPGIVCWVLVAGLLLGCSKREVSTGVGTDREWEPPNEALARIVKPWQGDLDGMIERRFVRVLTVASPVLYFVDQGRQRGAVYEMGRRFEKHLNSTLKKRNIRLHVVILPVGRDELIPRLITGQGDLAIALLTMTPEREALVDFSIPVVEGVSEVLVTGSDSAPVERLEDLAGRTVYIRPSSSYAEHLANVNKRFIERGLPPVEISPADELLEAGDILEMVHAGLVPATIIDSPLAELYGRIFDDLHVHSDITFNTGGQIGWAFRKNSPELASMVNGFLKSHRQGTLFGNVLIERYLEDTRWAENARDKKSRERYRAVVDVFRKYAERYGLDTSLLVAQAYQESKLDHSRRSPAGAIGIMQMLPSTARDKNVGIPDITGLENNIHAGAKYLSWIIDRYYDDPDMSRMQRELFALASYNAGPARIARLRKEAAERGLDPNRWFDNVEVIAAKRIGRETVQYVANVYKYYLATRKKAREKALGG